MWMGGGRLGGGELFCFITVVLLFKVGLFCWWDCGVEFCMGVYALYCCDCEGEFCDGVLDLLGGEFSGGEEEGGLFCEGLRGSMSSINCAREFCVGEGWVAGMVMISSKSGCLFFVFVLLEGCSSNLIFFYFFLDFFSLEFEL